MPFAKLISLFLLLIASISSHAEQWLQLGVMESTKKHLYIDVDSIENDGVLVRLRSKNETVRGFFSFDPYKERIDFYVLNCSEKLVAVTKTILVKDSDEQVITWDKPVVKEMFAKVPSGSLLESNWSRFCPTKVASAPVATPAIPEKPAKPEISVTSGTGWHVADGYIVTAFHVIEGASAIGVDIGKDEYLPAKVITYDASNDLAILHVQHPSLKDGLTLATSSTRLGGKVFTLGYPLPDALGVKIQVTSGEVSALTGAANDPRFYQITAPVQSGASGGPVFSEDGQVVGVIISKTNFMKQNTGRVEILQNINFAVKYPYVAALLETSGVRIIRQTKKSANREDAVKQAAGQVFYIEAYRKKE